MCYTYSNSSIEGVQVGEMQQLGEITQLRNVAVMKHLLFLLTDRNIIEVYDRHRKTVIKTIHVADLGLLVDSTMKKIWAGDTEGKSYVLHVLYSRHVHSNILASFSVDINALLNK